MHLSDFTGLIAIILFIAGATLAGEKMHSWDVYHVASLILITIGVIFVFVSARAKGWIGPSYKDLKNERKMLEEIRDSWFTGNTKEITEEEKKKRERLDKRYTKVIQMLSVHPEKPD